MIHRSIARVFELSAVEQFALMVGPSNVQWAGCADVDDQFWADAWAMLGSGVLEAWVAQHPGTRPWAFWRFDWPELRGGEDEDDDDTDDQADEKIDDQDEDDDEDDEEEDEDEDQAARLHRAGLLEPTEMEAIRVRALMLVAHNRGRRLDPPGDNFIPPDGPDRLAIALGLLSSEEAAILAYSPKRYI
jgi:hypothetical protein